MVRSLADGSPSNLIQAGTAGFLVPIASVEVKHIFRRHATGWTALGLVRSACVAMALASVFSNSYSNFLLISNFWQL